MNIYLFTHPEDIDEQQFNDELLPQLPTWRREQSLRFRFLIDRVLCAKAFIMLSEALRHDYGIADELLFDYGFHGKPTLNGHGNIHFNLSHCRKGILCVVDETSPVGCDIETVVDTINPNLIDNYFSLSEKTYIQCSNSPLTAFTELWTRKEAFLKYTGDGLTDNLSTILETPLAQSLTMKTTTCDNQFAYTICGHSTKNAEPKLIQHL